MTDHYGKLKSVAWIGLVFAVAGIQGQELFQRAERQQIVEYWSADGRYTIGRSGDLECAWQPRQTPDGSVWIREVYKIIQPGKVDPKKDLTGTTPEQRAWTSWIERRYAADELWANAECLRLNQGGSDPASGAPAVKPSSRKGEGVTEVSPIPPPDPLPCPPGLLALVGAPPRLVAPAQPMRHMVVFDEGLTLTYEDHVKVRRKYAYYRFAEGVMSAGTPVSALEPNQLNRLATLAGINLRDLKIMSAVSLLEGGFDSVNTYDTGFVSVGLIQFASLVDGRGSLGRLLRSYKQSQPRAFEDDFRRFGLEVTDDGFLVAIDLESGQELTGYEAALAIIRDKRLIAVFQRAGRREPFQTAQLRSAYEQFFPANEILNVSLGGVRQQVRAGDVFRSEAGLATLMDRKVNIGNIRDVAGVVESLAAKYGIRDRARLADIEHLAVRQLRYRQDFTASRNLTQPRDTANALTSRSGSRAQPVKKRPKK
ncbi:MAG: hypothetical protein KF884_07010 [Fimbriimonadaceae bacterium]|nr:hypothetical protein [Fimbriimonadaceae bacterium]QYK57298.1 MAG: hypothetical protein KF884_07010 [Fimbriimonadaceae bacterium]